MNTGFAVFDKSFKVTTSDELTSDYRVVKGGAAGYCTLCGANERPLGIAQCYQGFDGDALDAGEPVNVRMIGKSKAVAAGTIAIWEALKPGAAGTVDGADYVEDEVFAIALEAATVGQVFDVLVLGNAQANGPITSGTLLAGEWHRTRDSVATDSITRHVLHAFGDITGTTAAGMGDVTKPTYGLMACFGRTAIATSAFSGTDTAADVRMINKLVNDSAYNMQGLYVKAKNYSTGTVGALTGAFIECVADGTDTAGSSCVLKLGTDGSTVDIGIDLSACVVGADIKFSNGLEFVCLATAVTANSTTTTKAAGCLCKTSHATGLASLFVSDGSKWQFLTNS